MVEKITRSCIVPVRKIRKRQKIPKKADPATLRHVITLGDEVTLMVTPSKDVDYSTDSMHMYP